MGQQLKPLDLPFTTIGGLFLSTCAEGEGRNGVAFRHLVDDRYVDISYAELRSRVVDLALGLRALGISAGDRVGISAENRLEWVLSDLATTSVGVVDVPVFPILTEDQLTYIFSNAGTTAIICSNAFQLRKVIKASAGIPSLRQIIVFDAEAIDAEVPERRVEREERGAVSVYSLAEISRRGHDVYESKQDEYARLVAEVNPEDLLTLIYTSGTTGTPKGVMLTHHNMVSNIKSALAVIPIHGDDIALSYLPLCHAFERMAGYYSFFALGGTIAFAENIDRLVTNLGEVRPTLMTTVPRFLERFKKRVEANARKGSPRDQKVFRWAVNTGLKWVESKEKSGRVGPLLKVKHAVADRLVFSKLRARTGDRLRFFISGGAPLPHDVGAFFIAAGMPIIEGYGLTESSPVIAANLASRQKLGTVGPPIPGVEVKIAEDGEILARGENIMLGYYNDPASTEEAIDGDRFLRTGDIGEFDDDGYLRITDRKKHIFVSSGGKNIAPSPIEEAIASLPHVSQVLLLGDDLPYLAALIVPDLEAVVDGLGELGRATPEGSDEEVLRALSDSEEVAAAIYSEIRSLQKDDAAYERVRKIELLPEEFTVENGMMTPTLKVKRKAIIERYRTLIQEMYPGETIRS